MNVPRRGFTLIEILITIGIVLVLVAITAYGISRVATSSKTNAARTTLGNLKSMVAELDAVAGLKGRQPSEWAWGTASSGRQAMPTPATGVINVWLDADPSTATTPTTSEPLLVPEGPVNSEFSSGGGVRYDSNAVVNTQLIMELLLSVPKNRDALAQIPAEQRMEKLPGTFTPKLKIRTASPPDRTPMTPIPLDPWRNPIIFVPASGLAGDDASDATKMWLGGEPGKPETKQVVAAPTGTAQVGPIQSPDRRPFWASAGPDGDFRTGDDNVYSFEN